MTLLPCAHCGKTNLKIGNLKPLKAQYFVSCFSCFAQVIGCKTEEEAKAAWNRRAVPEGFVMVPVEPTMDMLDAGYRNIESDLDYQELTDAYKAMIKKAREKDNA